MKKLKKEEEFMFILNSSRNERDEYVKIFGICSPNLLRLFKEYREIFNSVISLCKKISNPVIELMIENEEYLEILMTRCLSEENQLKFVQYWPEKVCQYLETLEKELMTDVAHIYVKRLKICMIIFVKKPLLCQN